MSVSLEILNKNNSYCTTTAATAKSVKAAESKSVSIPVEENAEKSVPNVDSFVHGGGSAKYGAYSKTIAMKNNSAEAASAASKVQAKGAKGASNVYLDVITNKAAKKAGLAVNPSNGQIIVNNSYDARKVPTYQKEVNRIHSAFWCQNGGWWTSGYGKCSRTAIATAASINTGIEVKPNEVADGCGSLGNDNISLTRNTKHFNVNYSQYKVNCNDAGINYFQFKTEQDEIRAINNELKNNRCVVAKTTYGGEHWVTITGTKNGKEAEKFEDFIGVDPWCNNPDSPNSQGCDGVFELYKHKSSNGTNQALHSDKAIFTIV